MLLFVGILVTPSVSLPIHQYVRYLASLSFGLMGYWGDVWKVSLWSLG